MNTRVLSKYYHQMKDSEPHKATEQVTKALSCPKNDVPFQVNGNWTEQGEGLHIQHDTAWGGWKGIIHLIEFSS